MSYWVTYYSITGMNPQRLGSGHQLAVPYQVFETKDVPVFIGVNSTKGFQEFHKAFQIEHLMTDPRFQGYENLLKNRSEYVALAQDAIKNFTSKEVMEKMRAAHIPYAPVYKVGEMMEDHHVKARNMILDVDYPGLGKIKIPNFAFRMSESPGEIKRQAPTLGQHTAEVLKEVGYTDAQIIELKEKKHIL
jgi:crotonobetainyl-CoA:carnitine CoA-transferase CaiB-like acyl-CoA transferase